MSSESLVLEKAGYGTIPVTMDPSGTWSWDANGTPLPMTEAEWAAAGWTRKGGAG